MFGMKRTGINIDRGMIRTGALSQPTRLMRPLNEYKAFERAVLQEQRDYEK
jgi:hypothetical protein